ncbi:DUF1439 domain-containing protein [Pseudoxanthomonas sp. CF125]|uniref:DUF1439 domain-containing protein n=1 Tax=Pseudoxanthomonas sp. CF125 TaxID=1855303 RepID=UPI0008846E49|nr:DUF1439 domain-containing protein [Pseudoxanthomonas sp. CF125]SDQ51129.1 Protein of unknown function [Pseudoxanthomonas sp. CF125]
MTFPLGTYFKAAWLALLLASAPAMAQTPSNEITVAAPQVQQYLDSAFPREYEALGGLFTLTARDPKLTIPASGERLLMAFSASASSAGGGDTPVGRIEMSSGLRYDPQGYALYLDQPTVDDVRPASPGQRVDEQTRVLLNLWLADYARKEPLYKLDPALLANFGTVKVESARIENGHIVVRFNQPVGMPDLSDAQD